MIRSSVSAIALLLAALAGGTGCSRNPFMPKSYNDSIDSGIRDIPFVHEFNSLFPGTENYITHYTGEMGPTSWGSQVILYGRYRLEMGCDIRLNQAKTKVEGWGDPIFNLMEVAWVEDRGSGVKAEDIGERWQFGLDKWKEIVRAKGDITAVFSKIVTDKPTIPH